MKKKSKFKSFVLSAVPGLGHIYIGIPTRGIIFMGAMFSLIFLLNLFHEPSYAAYGFHRFNQGNSYKELLGICIPALWFFSVIDNYIMTEKINKLIENSEVGHFDFATCDSEMTVQNQKLTSIIISIVPGGGHIYCGMKNKGLQIMAVFFSITFLSYITGFGILNLVSGILWLYGILDIITINSSLPSFNSGNLNAVNMDSFLPALKNKLHWLGGILITLGLLLILNRIASDFIDSKILKLIEDYAKNMIISAALIFFGVKLVLGNKHSIIK